MIKQIAVFLENKAGKASACCKVLKDANVNLLALSIADTQDFGILRLITEDNAKALTALKGAGYISSEVELVGLEVPDKAGALSDLLIALGDGGISVEYMYSYAGVDGHAKIAFKTATPEKAIDVLTKAGAKLI
ncbi:MAG: amino acid-binding protein [Clostridia bacterium]|nr:amino acid-binding protein [Clostridia bacterium]MBQ8446748.1 amino acid-binding protein [Clostridia bacterium]